MARLDTDDGLRRVVVVDDDADWREFLRLSLEELGYDTMEAADGQEALDSLRRGERFEVMLLDLNMPGMSGLDLQSRLREAGCPFPVVVITARPTPQIRAEAERRGAVAFFAKPFGDDELLTCIADNIH